MREVYAKALTHQGYAVSYRIEHGLTVQNSQICETPTRTCSTGSAFSSVPFNEGDQIYIPSLSGFFTVTQWTPTKRLKRTFRDIGLNVAQYSEQYLKGI